MNAPIVVPPARSKEVQLPGTPSERLHSGLVVRLGPFRGSERARVPDVDEIVIAARGEHGAVGAPFETADFRGVGVEFGDFVFGNAHIVVVDVSRAGAGGEDGFVP